MKKIKQTLIEALKESGRIIKTNINKSKRVHYKGEIDLLTVTDKQVEKTVTRLVRKRFPSHDVLAEEASAHKDASRLSAEQAGYIPAEYKWIIDPVDGTTNFYHSFPHVCTSIAIERDCTVVMGGIYDPLRDELFFTEYGKGAFCNGKRIHVSGITKLKKSLLVTGFPYDRRKHADFYLRFFKVFMMKCHGVRRGGSAALDLCYVACGRIDGFWELKLHPWDVAAGALLVKEAGGRITDFGGKPYTVYGTETLATNGKIHKEMIRVIKKVRAIR